jgi:hypothetical protein
VEHERFDALTARLTADWNRRRTVLGLFAGTAGMFGLAADADTKKGRKRKKKKKRCGRLQARCRSNKQCCPGKTGRVCASNDKDVQCRGGGTVCCLPVNAFGCDDFCDCCGGNTGCVDGQCKVVF